MNNTSSLVSWSDLHGFNTKLEHLFLEVKKHMYKEKKETTHGEIGEEIYIIIYMKNKVQCMS